MDPCVGKWKNNWWWWYFTVEIVKLHHKNGILCKSLRLKILGGKFEVKSGHRLPKVPKVLPVVYSHYSITGCSGSCLRKHPFSWRQELPTTSFDHEFCTVNDGKFFAVIRLVAPTRTVYTPGVGVIGFRIPIIFRGYFWWPPNHNLLKEVSVLAPEAIPPGPPLCDKAEQNVFKQKHGIKPSRIF